MGVTIYSDSKHLSLSPLLLLLLLSLLFLFSFLFYRLYSPLVRGAGLSPMAQAQMWLHRELALVRTGGIQVWFQPHSVCFLVSSTASCETFELPWSLLKLKASYKRKKIWILGMRTASRSLSVGNPPKPTLKPKSKTLKLQEDSCKWTKIFLFQKPFAS